MDDYKTDEVLYQHFFRNNKIIGPYVVLSPVRTKAGKLRLRGPRGGYVTTWWHKVTIPNNAYEIISE